MIPRNINIRSLLLVTLITTLILGIVVAYNSGLRESHGTKDGTREADLRAQHILTSEFGGLFDLDDTWISPMSVFGDFTGDGVDDLAAAVRVNRRVDSDAKVPEMWFGKPIGPGDGEVSTTRAVEDGLSIGDLNWYRENRASVLIIIHGNRERGLLDTQPSQRFVLVDGWDRGKLKMSLSKGELKITRYGDEPKLVRPPVLSGKAIVLTNPFGWGNAVYWDGTEYRWYPIAQLPDSPK